MALEPLKKELADILAENERLEAQEAKTKESLGVLKEKNRAERDSLEAFKQQMSRQVALKQENFQSCMQVQDRMNNDLKERVGKLRSEVASAKAARTAAEKNQREAQQQLAQLNAANAAAVDNAAADAKACAAELQMELSENALEESRQRDVCRQKLDRLRKDLEKMNAELAKEMVDRKGAKRNLDGAVAEAAAKQRQRIAELQAAIKNAAVELRGVVAARAEQRKVRVAAEQQCDAMMVQLTEATATAAVEEEMLMQAAHTIADALPAALAPSEEELALALELEQKRDALAAARLAADAETAQMYAEAKGATAQADGAAADAAKDVSNAWNEAAQQRTAFSEGLKKHDLSTEKCRVQIVKQREICDEFAARSKKLDLQISQARARLHLAEGGLEQPGDH